ncbi:MAG: hypothetical protein ACYC9O_01355 [Candidatus Latescibacterota bacterium]
MHRTLLGIAAGVMWMDSPADAQSFPANPGSFNIREFGAKGDGSPGLMQSVDFGPGVRKEEVIREK